MQTPLKRADEFRDLVLSDRREELMEGFPEAVTGRHIAEARGAHRPRAFIAIGCSMSCRKRAEATAFPAMTPAEQIAVKPANSELAYVSACAENHRVRDVICSNHA